MQSAFTPGPPDFVRGRPRLGRSLGIFIALIGPTSNVGNVKLLLSGKLPWGTTPPEFGTSAVKDVHRGYVSPSND